MRASRVLWEELEKLVKEKGEVSVKHVVGFGENCEYFLACVNFSTDDSTPIAEGATVRSALAKLVDAHKRIVP
jgi:hypothetical protein